MSGFLVSHSNTEGDMKTNSYYTNVNTQIIRVWDMPGGGTPAHPLDTYFEELCLLDFDAIFLFYTTRWTSLHDKIITQAYTFGVLERLYIIINKASLTLDQYAYNKHASTLEVRQEFYASTIRHIRQKLQLLEREGVPKVKLDGISMYFACSQSLLEGKHQEKTLLSLLESYAVVKSRLCRLNINL